MRISDWSSDVCSSDLVSRWSGTSGGWWRRVLPRRSPARSITPSTTSAISTFRRRRSPRSRKRAPASWRPEPDAMSAKILTADEPVAFYDLDEHPHPEGHSTMLGFWIYLMSDCLIFAILFACYAVLGGSYAAGPAPKDLFDLKLIALNTAMLLFSSITYGFAVLQMQQGKVKGVQIWLGVTGLFGLALLGIEDRKSVV